MTAMMSRATNRCSSLTAITSLFVSLIVLAAPAKAADPYPTKPIRIIVGTAPGGSADVVARILAQKLQQPERLGQSVVVENKPGGALLIGMAAVANAAPDGYTIGMVANSYATMEDLYKNLPLKESDLKPVVLLGTVPSLFLVQGDAPYNNVADFMKYAKEHPGKLNFASAGIGTLTYLLPFALFVQNGLDMVHVPFPGAGPSMTALLGKQVDALFDAMTTGAQTVEGKQTKALATTGATRSARFPDLPTLIEQGYPIQGNTWLGIVAPKDVPKPIIDKLNTELNIVLQDPDVKKRFSALELETVGGSSEKFGEYVAGEKKFWGKIVRDAGLKLDN